jgi:hypothetical protein
VSNYRVQQVLALGEMPGRQLRLLTGLATFMGDDSRSVSVGFDALITVTGNVRNTVRIARREFEERGSLSSEPGNGRGHLTLWTVLCLPEKGVSVLDPLYGPGKGVNDGSERGSTSTEKGGQPKRADLQEPERGLNRLSNPSLSGDLAPLAAILTKAVPGADEREISDAVKTIETRAASGEIRDARAWLRTIVRKGDASALIADARNRSAPMPPRPAWCGQCDERTRQRDAHTDHPSRCPDCHPLAARTTP